MENEKRHKGSQFPMDRDWLIDTMMPISAHLMGSYTALSADLMDPPVEDTDEL